MYIHVRVIRMLNTPDKHRSMTFWTEARRTAVKRAAGSDVMTSHRAVCCMSPTNLFDRYGQGRSRTRFICTRVFVNGLRPGNPYSVSPHWTRPAWRCPLGTRYAPVCRLARVRVGARAAPRRRTAPCERKRPRPGCTCAGLPRSFGSTATGTCSSRFAVDRHLRLRIVLLDDQVQGRPAVAIVQDVSGCVRVGCVDGLADDETQRNAWVGQCRLQNRDEDAGASLHEALKSRDSWRRTLALLPGFVLADVDAGNDSGARRSGVSGFACATNRDAGSIAGTSIQDVHDRRPRDVDRTE